MGIKTLSKVILVVAGCLAASPLAAQQTYTEAQKKLILGQLINAFQVCGPPSAYQLLGQAVFQAVAMQTQNTGCYPYLQMLGRVQDVSRTASEEYPAGPVEEFEVQQQNGTSYWQMGISKFTGKVEWLTVNSQRVPVPAFPKAVADVDTGGTKKQPKHDEPAGCQLYPQMCVDM